MAKPGIPQQGEYVDLPEMEWITCEITSADIEDGEYQGKARKQVKVILKALDGEYQGGTVTYWAGFSLHEKSKLRPLAEAVTGLSPEALFLEFDTDDLVGKKVQLIGKTVTSVMDGVERRFLKPTMFKSATATKKAAGSAVPTASPEPVPAAAGAIDI